MTKKKWDRGVLQLQGDPTAHPPRRWWCQVSRKDSLDRCPTSWCYETIPFFQLFQGLDDSDWLQGVQWFLRNGHMLMRYKVSCWIINNSEWKSLSASSSKHHKLQDKYTAPLYYTLHQTNDPLIIDLLPPPADMTHGPSCLCENPDADLKTMNCLDSSLLLLLNILS